jgi:hypothetical protein
MQTAKRFAKKAIDKKALDLPEQLCYHELLPEGGSPGTTPLL